MQLGVVMNGMYCCLHGGVGSHSMAVGRRHIVQFCLSAHGFTTVCTGVK